MSNEHDSEGAPQELNQILDTPELAEALENERFKQFLDHLPIAIAVSECGPQDRLCEPDVSGADSGDQPG